MVDTVFGGVVTFLDRLGVYDILLPFLLVFTIVFAILEKTRILGVDKEGDKEYTKKNLNAIVAFVVGFLVVASASIVRVINDVLASVVLLLIVIISFLMMVGIFLGTGEVTLEKFPKWMSFLFLLVFIAIVLIFLNALGWLRTVVGLVLTQYNSEWVATLILLIIVVSFMVYITWDRKREEKK